MISPLNPLNFVTASKLKNLEAVKLSSLEIMNYRYSVFPFKTFSELVVHVRSNASPYYSLTIDEIKRVDVDSLHLFIQPSALAEVFRRLNNNEHVAEVELNALKYLVGTLNLYQSGESLQLMYRTLLKAISKKCREFNFVVDMDRLQAEATNIIAGNSFEESRLLPVDEWSNYRRVFSSKDSSFFDKLNSIKEWLDSIEVTQYLLLQSSKKQVYSLEEVIKLLNEKVKIYGIAYETLEEENQKVQGGKKVIKTFTTQEVHYRSKKDIIGIINKPDISKVIGIAIGRELVFNCLDTENTYILYRDSNLQSLNQL